MSKGPDTDAVGTPRWAKVVGIIVVVVIIGLVILLVTGTGSHGPGRHTPGNDTSGGHAGPPPGVTHSQP